MISSKNIDISLDAMYRKRWVKHYDRKKIELSNNHCVHNFGSAFNPLYTIRKICNLSVSERDVIRQTVLVHSA